MQLILSKFEISRLVRLTKESAWILIGQVISTLGSLVLVRVLTGYLNPAQYGELALGLTIVTLIGQIVTGGIGNGIGRYYPIAVDKNDLYGYLSAVCRLMVNATVVIVIIGLIINIGLAIFGYTKWRTLVIAALLLAIFNGLNSSLNSIQNAARKRAVVAFHGGLDAWMKIIVVIGVISSLGISSTNVVVGYTISSLIVLISQLIFLRNFFFRKVSPVVPYRSDWGKHIWAYSWPFSVWGVFTWAHLASDRWALEVFATTREVGYFAVLFQLGYYPITLVVGLITNFLGPILFQRAGDASDKARIASVQRIVRQFNLGCLVVSFFLFLLAFGVHDWVFAIFVAEEYRLLSYLFPWFVLSGGLFAAAQTLALKLMSDLRSSNMIRIKVTTALIGIAFNYLGANLAGIQGITAAAVSFSLIYLIWISLLANKRL